uniref:Uncharacterized protein n=1 Tax=Rhizophora mucronata TaxID=61149 RepID=A0A2P2NYL6_RHIMU
MKLRTLEILIWAITICLFIKLKCLLLIQSKKYIDLLILISQVVKYHYVT